MLDKLFVSNQSIYVRREEGPPDVHQRIVRNLEVTDGSIYGECTIDHEDWIVRYAGPGQWRTIGKKVNLDALVQGLKTMEENV